MTQLNFLVYGESTFELHKRMLLAISLSKEKAARLWVLPLCVRRVWEDMIILPAFYRACFKTNVDRLTERALRYRVVKRSLDVAKDNAAVRYLQRCKAALSPMPNTPELQVLLTSMAMMFLLLIRSSQLKEDEYRLRRLESFVVRRSEHCWLVLSYRLGRPMLKVR